MIEIQTNVPEKPVQAGPLVSVIIPVYQGERLILGAVQSALNQTHRDLEVFVVDDGSTDQTLAVLASLEDPRLTVLQQENAGTASARNLALAQARGRYIAFLDSDDRWFPEKIATEIGVLESAGTVGIAYSSYYAVDDRGRLQNLAPNRDHAGNALDLLLDGEDFLMPSVCLFDRRIFDTLGYFNAKRFHEDHEFILRASRHYPIFPTGKRLAVYRQTTSGKCRGILADYERAKLAELAVVADLAKELTPEQHLRLKQNALRSLYCRFLMYGFSRHARRMLGEFRITGLQGSKKGRLAWLFAKSNLNLLSVAREAIQGYHLLFRQGWWRKRQAQSCLHLDYGVERGERLRFKARSAERETSPRVCVAVPTFRRPVFLRALLEGIALQSVPAGCPITVVVIDNDSRPSAQTAVEEIRDGFPFTLEYVHLKEPGLSSVRNFALSYARDRFDFLAMIDDDEYPQREWLQELLRVQERIGADVVIGPVPKVISSDAPAWIQAGHFYELPSYPDGALIKHGHSGNCLLKVSSMERFGVAFDKALNLAGGEDMLFFRQLLARGAKLTYATRAVAFESMGAERLRVSYIVKLNFRRGNTLTFCDRRLDGSFFCLLMRAIKGCGRIALGLATILPLAVTRGRIGIVSAVCNIAHGLGSLAGLVGHVYNAYKRAD